MAGTLNDSAREIFLDHGPGDTEPRRNFIYGATVATLQEEGRSGVRGQLGKTALQRFEPPLQVQRSGGIGLVPQARPELLVEEIQGLRHTGGLEGVLMNDVARYGQQIRFWISNLLVPFGAQQAQENLLRQICNVGGIAQPGGQKAAQSLTVLGGQLCDKTPTIIRNQCTPLPEGS